MKKLCYVLIGLMLIAVMQSAMACHPGMEELPPRPGSWVPRD